MIQATTKELENKYVVNGVKLDQDEWYMILRILRKCNLSEEAGEVKNPGRGRRAKVFTFNPKVGLNFVKND